jgi:galactokinase
MPVADPRAARLLAGLPGAGPAVLVRAPGRVNLIGEHTDYNGLPVLPFAIERDVLVAARARGDGHVDIANVDGRFPPRRFRLERPIPPLPAGEWGNYVQAAAQALLDAGASLPAGATLHVDGNLPPAAGVSSSSALVVASALALDALGSGETTRDRLALAELLARGEQYVGTLSGGMDQAAILLARPGHALRLDFFPLRARAVPVPAEATFVLAHTLDEAAKAGDAGGQYNQRVVECRLACAVLGRRLGCRLERLGDLTDPAAVQGALATLLPAGTVSRTTLVNRLGVPHAELERLAPPSVTLANPDRFVLRARVRHVLAEAARVAQAEEAIAAGDVRALGALLDASHASAAADYEISTPAADAMVRDARAAGALGARLMGAGFGGAALLLVERERADALIAALDARLYVPRRASRDARFVVSPSAGASAARVDCP